MSFLRNLLPRRHEMKKSSPWEFRDDAALHRRLQEVMTLYNFLTHEQQSVIRDFVGNFYTGKEVLVSPELRDVEEPLLAIAANAALVGAAQKTHYFSTVKWIHLCTDDLEAAGDARGYSTVRVRSDICVDDSKYLTPGDNLVAHEFAHVLDAQFGLSGSTEGLREGFRQYLHDLRNGNQVPIADCFTDFDDFDDSPEGQDANFHSDIEFFASASEAFFTNAHELREYHAKLYEDLSSIYGLDLADLDWDEIWKA